MVLNCPKVNYKLNYKPGTLICPRTHELVLYNDVKDKVARYAKMPIEYKKTNLKNTPLVDLEPIDAKTDDEELAEYFQADIGRVLGYPFAY